jgi:hypothetical protein
MTVVEVTGADMSGGASGAFVTSNTQKHNGTGTATSVSLTMNAAADSNNRAFGFFVHTAAENITQDANNTLGSTGNYTTPNRGAGFVWNTSAFNNPGASWTTAAAWRAIGSEIKVAAAVVPPRRTAYFFPSRARGARIRQANRSRFGWR